MPLQCRIQGLSVLCYFCLSYFLTPVTNNTECIKLILNVTYSCFKYRVAKLYLMWNSRTFPRLSRTFLKQIQDLLYQLKPERFTHFFKTNFIIWLYWQITLDKNQDLQIRTFCFTALSYQKYFNSIFLFLKIKKEIFCLLQFFQGSQPKFKNFPRPGIFFLPIPEFSRIFKDCGNPAQTLTNFYIIWPTAIVNGIL